MRENEPRTGGVDSTGDARGRTDPHETAERLREELQSLRESGCTMLVVGEVPATVSRRACATLNGGPDHEHVTVRTGCGCSCEPHDGGHTVQWADQARGGATTADETLQFATETETTAEVGTLSALGEATAAAIAEAADGTDPGELRVCVDSLGPLVEATSERSVFRALHQLNAAVREARGLGHVHLPMARESERATVLGALFDVTVELELFGGEPRQRWYLHEAGIVSDWLPIGVGDE